MTYSFTHDTFMSLLTSILASIKVVLLLLCISFIVYNAFGVHQSDKLEEDRVRLHRIVRQAHTKELIYLLQQGLPVDSRNDTQDTLLHEAALFGNTAIVQLLIQAHAPVNAVNALGMTPLHLASFGRYKDIVQLLIASGAQVNLQDSFGRIPLHYAVFNNDKNLIDILLHAGALVCIKDKTGLSPLEWALSKASGTGEQQDVFALFNNGKAQVCKAAL